MARQVVKVRYDREGDFLEVTFEDKDGYVRETERDQVMERVATRGHVIGFSILRVSSLSDKPLEVALN